MSKKSKNLKQSKKKVEKTLIQGIDKALKQEKDALAQNESFEATIDRMPSVSIQVTDHASKFREFIMEKDGFTESLIDVVRILDNPFKTIVGQIPDRENTASEFSYYRMFYLSVTMKDDESLKESMERLRFEMTTICGLFPPVGHYDRLLCVEVPIHNYDAPAHPIRKLLTYLAFDLPTYDRVKNYARSCNKTSIVDGM